MQIAPGSMLTPSLKAGLRPLPVLALNGPQYLTIRGDVRHCRSSMSLTISASKAKLLPTRRSPYLICRSAYDAASTTASTPPPAGDLRQKSSALLRDIARHTKSGIEIPCCREEGEYFAPWSLVCWLVWGKHLLQYVRSFPLLVNIQQSKC